MADIAMADTPVEVSVNTESLDEFEQLFHGKAVAKSDETEDVVDTAEETPVDDTDETEDETTEEAETEGEETPDEDAEDPEDEEEIVLKPKKKSAKDRIDELTAEKYAERRLREDTERRLADLERQLREAEPKQEAKPANTPRPPHPDDVDDRGQALYPMGEFDRNFVADVSRFESTQQLAALREEMRLEAETTRQQAEDRVRFDTWNTKLDKTTETLPDLRETIAGLEKNFSNIDPNYGLYLSQTIMGMDAGPEVLYYLANHPEEADRIVASGPTGATLALGRLEARIQSALTKKANPQPRVTTAQRPPVNTRGSGAKAPIRADTENLDDFEKLFYSKK